MNMINLSAKLVFQLLNFKVLLDFNNKLIERGGFNRDRSLIIGRGVEENKGHRKSFNKEEGLLVDV